MRSRDDRHRRRWFDKLLLLLRLRRSNILRHRLVAIATMLRHRRRVLRGIVRHIVPFASVPWSLRIRRCIRRTTTVPFIGMIVNAIVVKTIRGAFRRPKLLLHPFSNRPQDGLPMAIVAGEAVVDVIVLSSINAFLRQVSDSIRDITLTYETAGGRHGRRPSIIRDRHRFVAIFRVSIKRFSILKFMISINSRLGA